MHSVQGVSDVATAKPRPVAGDRQDEFVTANTSVFAKLDVTFGDDLEGVGGKAGMRVSW